MSQKVRSHKLKRSSIRFRVLRLNTGCPVTPEPLGISSLLFHRHVKHFKVKKINCHDDYN